MKKISIFILLIIPLFIMAQSDMKKQNKTNNNVKPYRIAIGFNPADFSVIHDGEKAPTGWMISMIEELLTGGYGLTNCPKSSGKSYVLVDTANPEIMKKYREAIERDNNDENIDPTSRITPHFITATHLVKGKGIIKHGCAMVNLRIEDQKGCIRAQKKITVKKGVKNLDDLSNLVVKAARSLHSQLCNPKFNEQSCSKAHYSDKLSCPLYFVITTTTEYNHQTKKTRPKGAAISGPKVLTSSYISSHKSKQIMYVDPKNGIVKLVGLKGDATSRYESERYKLDKKQCAFIHKRDETKVNKSLQSSLAKIVRHNIFEANNNAFIELKVTNNNFRKKFKIPWATLKDSGSWSGNGSKNTYDAPSAKDKAIQDSIKNTEIYKMVTVLDKGFANSGMLAKTNDDARKTAAILGLNKKWLCTIYEGELAYGYQKIDLSFNAKINVDISPATKSEIDLMRNISDNEDIQTYRAREIKLSKFEKEPQSIFDGLQNSLYDDISQDDKKAWDRADKEHKKAVQNKKDLEEYNNLSMDDLEMFTK